MPNRVDAVVVRKHPIWKWKKSEDEVLGCEAISLDNPTEPTAVAGASVTNIGRSKSVGSFLLVLK